MDNLTKWLKYHSTLLKESDIEIYDYEEEKDIEKEIEIIEIENDIKKLLSEIQEY